ncbi:MAG: proton-conducting transporter membrane subunit [Myxococcota bacterium]
MPITSWSALVAAFVPVLLGFVVSRWAHLPAYIARSVTVWSMGLALVAATLALVGVLATGPSDQVVGILVLGPAELTFGAYVDRLSVLLLVMVCLIGLVVSRYSVRYLDGDPGQARFSQWLAFTVSMVLFLLIARNLVLLWTAWVLSSLGLHKLLTFYGERPAAQFSARKKFIISRLGDLFLLVGFVLTYIELQTLEILEIFEQADGLATSETAPTIAFLFVLGAMTKSAQFPMHTWLPDTMETPTPVSALMHAGIINAGGFLLIRLSPVLIQVPAALWFIAAVGAFTAIFASTVMLTQTDIKRKLAYSTVGQMGFMMLQIGLGAFAVATMHIVGHSFYKAHAFLSSSSTVKSTQSQPHDARPPSFGFQLLLMLFGLVVGTGLVLTGATASNVGIGHKPGILVLGTVLAMAIAQMVVTAQSLSPRKARSTLMALRNGAGLVILYFILAAGFQWFLGPSLPDARPTPMGLAVAILVGFGLVLLLQTMLPVLAQTRFGRHFYVRAFYGFYIGTRFNRLVERVWPLAPSR